MVRQHIIIHLVFSPGLTHFSYMLCKKQFGWNSRKTLCRLLDFCLGSSLYSGTPSCKPSCPCPLRFFLYLFNSGRPLGSAWVPPSCSTTWKPLSRQKSGAIIELMVFPLSFLYITVFHCLEICHFIYFVLFYVHFR